MESLDDLRCVVCVKVLSEAAQHVPCQKFLCGACFGMLASTRCPVCTLQITTDTVLMRTDIDQRVVSEQRTCSCGRSFSFKDIDDHTDNCPTAQTIFQSTVRQAVIQPNHETANRSTFTCPFCSIKNFVRETLISHIESTHDEGSGVCPICVAMPWGDPNIECSNLLGHLKHRHKYDVDTYTDFGMEDDDILRRVLEESKLCR